MSLETQITALVTAANALTASVNGKMADINQKVNDAVASVPGSVKSYLETRTTYYVDHVNGDDTKDGLSWANAKRSLKSAIGAVGVRRYAVIFLSKGTHLITSDLNTPDGSDIWITGDPVALANYTNVVEADRDQYVIQRPDYAGGLPGTGDCLFRLGEASTVYFRGVRVNYGDVPHRPAHWSSFFKITSSSRIKFIASKIESRDGTEMANIELGSLVVTATYSKFVALAGTNVGLLRGYSQSSYGFFGGYNNTLTNFVMNGSIPFQPA